MHLVPAPSGGLRRPAPSFSSLLGNPEERAVCLYSPHPSEGKHESDWGDENDGAEVNVCTLFPLLLAAYGAPRRHSRACSGIQRNEQYAFTPPTRQGVSMGVTRMTGFGGNPVAGAEAAADSAVGINCL